jgi:uncharacterized protein (DUF1697 family)
MVMTTWIAFLRGINVGGNNMLSMNELAILLEKIGCSDVNTYLQSGNVVFRSSRTQASNLAKQISRSVVKRHGIESQVFVLKVSELEQAAASNPYPNAESDPKTLHLYFLSESPSNPDLEGLAQTKSDNERFTLSGKVFYLHAPDGIGRSNLAPRVERFLGVDTTARNWNTVCKVLDIAKRY